MGLPTGRTIGPAIAAAAIVALALPAAASSRSEHGAAYSRYYVDELKVSKAIERGGTLFNGRTLAVDNASCLGLRRYGVRESKYGLDKFWRFKCSLNGSDNHSYTMQVSTTKGPKRGWFYWHELSIRRDF